VERAGGEERVEVWRECFSLNTSRPGLSGQNRNRVGNRKLFKLTRPYWSFFIKSEPRERETMPTIKAVNSASEFETLLNGTASPASLLVVDFWATWCGPCRASMTHFLPFFTIANRPFSVAPHFERLAKEFPHALFAKVDVDVQREVARTYQIAAMYGGGVKGC
jgi:thiol-disulfide isomerase/thioredoxin